MIRSVSAAFYDRSPLRLAIVATGIVTLYLFAGMIPAASCFAVPGAGPSSLGASFGVDAQTVQSFLTARSGDMMACYQRFNGVWDNIFAPLYGLMYVAWLSWLFWPWRGRFGLLNLLPLGQTLLDWGENAGISLLVRGYLATGQADPATVRVTSALTQAKWVAFGVVMVLVLIGIGARIGRAVNRRRRG